MLKLFPSHSDLNSLININLFKLITKLHLFHLTILNFFFIKTCVTRQVKTNGAIRTCCSDLLLLNYTVIMFGIILVFGMLIR